MLFQGYDDNGSGIVALMEILRAFSWSKCQLKYTLIVVAFDLEEYGVQGGTAFVQEYLMEHIIKPFNLPTFQVNEVEICVLSIYSYSSI